ncbi:MAG TPA: hypothetical protein VK444_05495 [Methanobacteriaceae archaeon]|nr:hypothetical protein [Methanobacteriaceae archaeon]
MPVLLTNITSELIQEALDKTGADSVISVLREGETIPIDCGVPLQMETIKLDYPEKVTERINAILEDAFRAGDVELVLEPDSLGLMILNTAKDFEIFKKKNIYVVNSGKLEKFKACLC